MSVRQFKCDDYTDTNCDDTDIIPKIDFPEVKCEMEYNFDWIENYSTRLYDRPFCEYSQTSHVESSSAW